ncbi:hypothetical protein [Cypionkella sp. TWP1-2-1b2]|uniref:hypothetical protein n=1 Tax=Cypionkella sp. TWP1-2-1b2 TaxID=2804675 RepID=UPI003CE6ACEF
MLKHVSQIGGMLALSVALGGAAVCAATVQTKPNRSEKGIVMVKQQAPVWLHCQFAAEPSFEVPGFCARLLADFTRQSGRVVSTQAAPPEGAQVLVVTVAPRNDHRATVQLAGGRQINGQFVPSATQQMRLGSMDAPLQAGSAAALVYPMVNLLETLR